MVTRPDAPAGRGRRLTPSPVAQLADELGVPVLKPDHPRDPEFQDALRDLRPDCCPVVAYGALLPQSALDIPEHGWVNLHFSCLPAWRGAAPVQHSIWAGDEVTGRDHVPDRQGDGRRPDVRGDDRADPRHRHRRRPAGPAGRGRCRAARGHPRRHRGRQPGGPAAAGRGHSATRPRSPSTTRTSTGPSPRVGVDRRIRACTPAPGAWTTYAGSAGQARAGDPHRRAAGAGRAPGRARPRCWSAPPPPRSGSAR